MTPENFCYWLQGLFEVGKPKVLTEEQVEEIRNHLALVFHKVTPDLTVSFDSSKFLEKIKNERYHGYPVEETFVNDIPTIVWPDGPIASC